MNILLTCVGRREYLVDYFKTALGGEGLVIATNSDPRTVGMAAADIACPVPMVDSPDYIPALLALCRRYRVGLLVSLYDIDLSFIAAAQAAFADIGVLTAVSDPWVVDVANDKWKTFRFLQEHDIGCPATFLTLEETEAAVARREVTFPLIVKPRWGMGSLALFTAHDMQELTVFHRHVRNQVISSWLNILSRQDMEHPVIVQECIEGEEYGVDVFNSLEGEHLATVVKRKLSMRAGETDSAITVRHEGMATTAGRLGHLLSHRGNLDIDIMLPAAGRPVVLEFNARFGGGYPFSHLAGVDFPGALIDLARNGRVRRGRLTPALGVLGMKLIKPCVPSFSGVESHRWAPPP